MRTDFSDLDAGLVLVGGSDLLVLGSELLAVTAPRGVELDEGVSVALDDLALEVALAEHGDVAGRSGGPLGLDAGVLLDEGDEVVLGPAALVLLRLLRVAAGEELEGGETTNRDQT